MTDVGFRPPVQIGTEIVRNRDGITELPVYEKVNIDGRRLYRLRVQYGITIAEVAHKLSLTVADVLAIEHNEAYVDVSAYEAMLATI